MGRLALAFLVCLLVVQIAAKLIRRADPVAPLVRVVASITSAFRTRVLAPTVLARRIGLRRGMRVLQVGKGDPALTTALAATVGPTGQVASVALETTDAGSLPFEDHSFDAVCLVSALGQFDDPGRALSEIWRVLRPAGRLSASEVLSDPAYRLRRTLEAWAELAGFERLEHFGNFVAYTTNFRKPLVLAPT